MSEEVKKENLYCVFGVGEKEFFIPKENIFQILDIRKIFPIPGAPDYIVGAIPLKGKIVPTIDLAKIYNIERLNYSDSKLLIIGADNERIGILSDITPFFVNVESDMVVENFIDPKKLFEELKDSLRKNIPSM